MDVLAAWVAARLGHDPAAYSDVTVEASEGRAWSDITIEDFSCVVRFVYEGDRHSYFMDERDVIDFLNQTWPVTKTVRTSAEPKA